MWSLGYLVLKSTARCDVKRDAKVLVSDGVTDVLPLEEVSQHVMRHTDAAAACKAGCLLR